MKVKCFVIYLHYCYLFREQKDLTSKDNSFVHKTPEAELSPPKKPTTLKFTVPENVILVN